MILCCYIPCIKWFNLLQYIVYFTRWLWQPDSIKKKRDKRNGYDVTKNSTVSLSMWEKHRKNCECCPVSQSIVMNSGSQLSELYSVSQMSQVSRIALGRCSQNVFVFGIVFFPTLTSDYGTSDCSFLHRHQPTSCFFHFGSLLQYQHWTAFAILAMFIFPGAQYLHP